MSRIGRLPITIPSGVDVTVDGSVVTVKGPKGTLTHTVVEPIAVERQDDGTLAVDADDVADAGVHQDLRDGDTCSTDTGDDDGEVLHLLVDDLERLEHEG